MANASSCCCTDSCLLPTAFNAKLQELFLLMMIKTSSFTQDFRFHRLQSRHRLLCYMCRTRR